MGAVQVVGRRMHVRVPASLGSILANCGLIAAGCVIFSYGLNGVLIPQKLLSGGVVGIAMLIHYANSSVGVGLAYLLLNIPLFILGWFEVGRRFMGYSVFGMLCLSFVATVVKPMPVAITDPMLGALLSGILCGTGGGLILRSLGSAGGLDIVAVFLNKKYGLRVGMVASATNILVLLGGSFIFGIEKTLYSIIYVYVSSRTVDAVLSGFNRRKVLIIVSNYSREIADQILHRINRGVTFLKGEGAYSGNDKEVIFSVTTLTELPKIKNLVFDIDPNAFLVVNDTLEVLGTRHGRRRVY